MKLYLSSTYIDLKRHRAILGRALRKSGYEVVMMEEYVEAERTALNPPAGDSIGVSARRTAGTEGTCRITTACSWRRFAPQC
jgi:hypothetical protein